MRSALIIVVLGTFTKVLQCVPLEKRLWGVPQRRINQLIVGGTNAIAQDFPWHAAIFHNSDGEWKYQCGGSLISERFVLTAKHCTLEIDEQLPAEKILVKLGLQRYKQENQNSQNRAVLKIYYPRGNLWEGFWNDIAIVELADDVEITVYVLPVLLVKEEPLVRTEGIVVGFGFDKENELAELLQKLEMPIIDTRECLYKHSNFKLDLGQFCAGQLYGKTACNGDSGGGLVFEKDGAYFLGGIVSYSDRQDGAFTCRLDGYSVFTSVYYYLPWINRITNLSDSINISHQPCGVSRIKRFRRIVKGQATQPGQWPWHVNIYLEKTARMEYVCGGTMLNERLILTGEICLNADHSFSINSRKIFVKFGVFNINEPNREYYSIGKIHLYDKKQDRIAVLQLSDEVVIIYTDFVRPVCLPEVDIDIGRYGTAIGFGLTEDDKQSESLRMAEMPVISSSQCKMNSDFARGLTDDLFCAGYLNGTTVCNGDGGGGIHFKKDNGAWYIGGIILFTLQRDESSECALESYGAFINIFKYMAWINSVITSTRK